MTIMSKSEPISSRYADCSSLACGSQPSVIIGMSQFEGLSVSFSIVKCGNITSKRSKLLRKAVLYTIISCLDNKWTATVECLVQTTATIKGKLVRLQFHVYFFKYIY